MAAYPSIDQSIGTRREILSGLTIEQSDDGSARGRSLFGETQYRFTVVHYAIDSTDRDTLLAFFEANKTGAVEFTYMGDSATYDCVFAGDPEEEYLEGGYWTVTLYLQGTAQ